MHASTDDASLQSLVTDLVLCIRCQNIVELPETCIEYIATLVGKFSELC